VSENQDRLSAALSAYRAPESLLAARDQQEQPDLAAGQLWRARVEGTAILVLVLGTIGPGVAEVVVATPGETPPAGSSVDHLVERTEVFRSLTLWPSLRGQLHQRVLDQMFESSETTARLSTRLALPTRVGIAPVDVLDPGAELLAELRDELQTLQDAPAVPVRDSHAPKLNTLLPGDGRAQLTLVMEQLALPQQQAMELLRGLRELSQEQAAALEQHLDLAAGSLPAAGGIEKDLALEVEHPRWREAARRRARELGVTEVEGRTSLAAEAYALAARESTAAPDWRQRLALLVADQP
jgi:hypothetical protein